MSRQTPDYKRDYKFFIDIPTRWNDNDTYGHVNNAVYYFYFDTVVNRYLIDEGWLNPNNSEIIGLVVDTRCSYFAPISFPDTIKAGLRVNRMGSSSVTYEIGLFRNDEETTSAQGHFVHVYVDEKTRRPAILPDKLTAILVPLLTQ